jgi:hypothetical protein
VNFGQIDLSLGQGLARGVCEVHEGFLDVLLDAETVAVHDAEAVVSLALALFREQGSQTSVPILDARLQLTRRLTNSAPRSNQSLARRQRSRSRALSSRSFAFLPVPKSFSLSTRTLTSPRRCIRPSIEALRKTASVSALFWKRSICSPLCLRRPESEATGESDGQRVLAT